METTEERNSELEGSAIEIIQFNPIFQKEGREGRGQRRGRGGGREE